MPALDDVALDLLWQAITDPSTRRRVSGRLRPRMVGRPHPRRRLPCRRRQLRGRRCASGSSHSQQ